MRELTFTFQSNGKMLKKRAMFKDPLSSLELSENKRNEAYDADMECWADGFWSIYFEGEPGVQYEIQLFYDVENRQMTLRPTKAITWENDVITDVQVVTIKHN